MRAKAGKTRISKKEWYALGGFENSKLFQQARKNGTWIYYRIN